MCAPSSLSQASTRSKHCRPVTNLIFVFLSLFFYLELFLERRRARQGCRRPVDVAAAMVFCVSCGNKLAGRYCRQCGAEDSQSTADAQVPVLTIPAEGAAKKQGQGKGRRSKDCQSAARDLCVFAGSVRLFIHSETGSRIFAGCQP
jgi:hypothetical protein